MAASCTVGITQQSSCRPLPRDQLLDFAIIAFVDQDRHSAPPAVDAAGTLEDQYDIAYLFVDGIAERIRPGQRREPVLRLGASPPPAPGSCCT
jgi:hypothetical protein